MPNVCLVRKLESGNSPAIQKKRIKLVFLIDKMQNMVTLVNHGNHELTMLFSMYNLHIIFQLFFPKDQTDHPETTSIFKAVCVLSA